MAPKVTRRGYRVNYETSDSRAAEEARSQEAFTNLNQELRRFIELWSEGHRDMPSLVSTEAAKTREHITDQTLTLKTQINVTAESSEKNASARHLATRNHLTSELTKNKEHNKREGLATRILSTLRFPEMNARENNIMEASEETTRWIFDEANSNLRFSKWLETDGPVFWISGKPGSGKSSLMKFLVSDAGTKQRLEKWRLGVVIYRYFFVEVCTNPLQREFRGCLQALLYQILDSNPHILDLILKQRPSLEAKHSGYDWSVEELRDVLLEALRLTKSPICLFLDGLDEISVKSNNRDSVIRLIEELGGLQDTKICVSSRPENIFKGRLSSYPCLQTQDTNGSAIKTYIQHRLAPYEPSFATDSSQYQELVAALARKASGVFLWVYLAIESIISGIGNADSWETLYERTEELEPDLDRLFQQMWERRNANNHLYKKDTARLLCYSLHANNMTSSTSQRSNLLGYIFGSHDGFRSTLLNTNAGDQRATEEKRVLEQYWKWLSARGAGLLEINKAADGQITSPDSLLLGYNVVFIHRSVQEFLLTTAAGHNILLANHMPSNERFLLTIRTMQDISCYHIEDSQRQVFDHYHYLISSLVNHLACAGRITVQEETRVFLDFQRRLQSQDPTRFPDSYFLEEAVEWHNTGFLSQELKAIEILPPTKKSIFLSTACDPKNGRVSDFTDLVTLDHRISENGALEYDWIGQSIKRMKDTIRLLLETGADPNAEVETLESEVLTMSLTPFHKFLCIVSHYSTRYTYQREHFLAFTEFFGEFDRYNINWDLPCYFFYSAPPSHLKLAPRASFKMYHGEKGYSDGGPSGIFAVSPRALRDFLYKVDKPVSPEQKETNINEELANDKFRVQCVMIRCLKKDTSIYHNVKPPATNNIEDRQQLEATMARGFLGWLYDFPREDTGIKRLFFEYCNSISA
ncbi:hypothetical protein M426DRAFT_16998 [Hypoxylon sp. CI-4A]|nr:hypothetical protein M426DRAFT_16998 [Hypoxylon sp. CI-4A]